MKRSEMVKLMTDTWLGIMPWDAPGSMTDPETYKHVSEGMSSLLSNMEYRGMKPPVEDTCPVLFTTKYVWEKEDA